jgi:DNA repair protein RecN (Recombination protein N)
VLRRLRVENLVLIREADLELGSGLNAITGETGAGKTILAQAIGLLLGARADASLVGPAASEAYVEAELDVPDGLLEEEGLEGLADLRPEDDDGGVVVARRVFGDGRTRAYAWGRSAAREDVAALTERLVAMSGQFEQRRLARPAYQLELLDAYAGEEQLARRLEARGAWRELQAARRRLAELERGAGEREARRTELRRLVEDTEGVEAGVEERLRGERERLRHAEDLVVGTMAAAEALAPEDGDGAAALAGRAADALAPISRLAADLAEAADEVRDAEVRLREAASALRSFLASLEVEPGRLEEVEAELDRLAEVRRRHRCATVDELLARTETARAELAELDDSGGARAAAAGALEGAEGRLRALEGALREARRDAAGPFATAVAGELEAIGMTGAEFHVELDERDPSPTGADEARFLVRLNPGLPFAPVAETASGGELSRIALAIAAVAGGTTLIFDEIDAGIGGRTANAVGRALRRLAERAQVVTITHLPQIASLADRHFRVEKVPGDPTHTTIGELHSGERRAEIERMLGGEEFLAQVR